MGYSQTVSTVSVQWRHYQKSGETGSKFWAKRNNRSAVLGHINHIWCYLKILQHVKMTARKINNFNSMLCILTWGATIFWVSTSIWESLLDAKKFHFSPCFYVSLTWASCAYDEKSTFLIIFKCFSLFSTMWTHAQACICWSKYTTIQN